MTSARKKQKVMIKYCFRSEQTSITTYNIMTYKLENFLLRATKCNRLY
jgi:hypothetical protein